MPISGNRAKRVIHGALNIRTGSVLLLITEVWDQLYFFLGRRHGRDILARFPTLKPRVERVDTLLHRYHLLLIPGIRFMYGLRIVGPIAFGMGRVEAVRFLFLNFIGATLWAPLIAGAGYLFGEALELLLHDIHRYEKLILGAFICFGLGACPVGPGEGCPTVSTQTIP